ncbi:MAG TPA: class I SAM-dependent methyltransferase [Bacteriovoracaceae bacterium]|nr:class I SAM-dependent methyltransferase [Bacteriovoracaceae bacterium]
MITQNLPQYELLDSGLGRKLEIIAGVKVVRPSPQAIWKPTLNESKWRDVTSECTRTKDGGGKWVHKVEPRPDLYLPFKIDNKELKFRLKFTSFGHCGVFFEQIPVWQWLYEEVKTLKTRLGRAPKVINLFGYTGCASLVMAAAGAEVFHVDSARGVLNWGKESQELSKIPAQSIRWVHEDAQAFLKHSFNKGFKYDGILADPPSWGHGVKKEVWDFEKHIHILVEMLLAVLNKENSFLFLSSHTHGVQTEALKNIIADKRWKTLEGGELGVKHQNDTRILPAGFYAAGRSYAKN